MALTEVQGADRAPALAVSDHGRIPALDGLRAVASLMVVFYHFGPHIVRDATSQFRFLNQLPRRGDENEGVTLFFVLSGFLISGILVNARESPRYFSTFYIRRAFRIFPLYYLVFLGYCVALWALGPRTRELGSLFENPLPVWSYAFYLQNFFMAAAASYGPIWLAGTWSLAIEEQFYFTFPLIARHVSDRTLARLAVCGFAGAVLLRFAILKFKFVPELAVRVLLPSRLDSLAAGILVMLLFRYRAEWLLGRRKQIGWVIGLTFILWLFYPTLNPQSVRMAFLNNAVNSSMCGAVLLYIVIAPAGWLARILSAPSMRLFGNMAYSTYLFHTIVLCVVFLIFKGGDPRLNTPSDLAPLALALITSLTLSWISWRFFEKPLIAAGRRFRY